MNGRCFFSAVGGRGVKPSVVHSIGIVSINPPGAEKAQLLGSVSSMFKPTLDFSCEKPVNKQISECFMPMG